MRKFSLIIISLFFVQSHAFAQDIDVLAEAFGTLPELSNIELSPDGKKLLMFQNVDGNIILVTRSLEDLTSPMNGFPMENGKYAWARWISNEEIIAGISYTDKSKGGTFFGMAYGMASVDWQGDEATLIADPNIKYGQRYPLYDLRLVDILEDDPDHILIQIAGEGNPQRGWKRDVYKRNIRTQRMEPYHKGIRTIKRWVTDNNHQVRVGCGRGNTIRMRDGRDIAHYRKTVDSPWIELYDYVISYGLGFEKEDQEERPFAFESFSPDPNKIYVTKENDNSNRGLYLYDLDTKQFEEIVSHDKYDLWGFEFDDDYNFEGYRYDGGQGKLIRVGERGERLGRIFDKSFPDSIVTIVSESDDRTIIVIKVTSPLDPGTFYLFNSKENKIEMLGYNYQKVDVDNLSDMTPVSYKARDGLEIPSYLSLPKGSDGKNLPTLIMPHGGPLAHDARRFDWWVQFLTSQGYAVLQPNYRGSTGYGDDFTKKGFFEWGRKMLEDINDGAKWMINQGYADPNNMCIVGWSYGGYAALQAVVKDQSLYKCSVAMAPVTDLDKEFEYIWTNFVESKDWTFDEASPADNIDKINIPVLLMQGDVDASVEAEHTRVFFRKMERRGKDIKYIEYENENHYLENQANRQNFLSETGAFLKKHIGG